MQLPHICRYCSLGSLKSGHFIHVISSARMFSLITCQCIYDFVSTGIECLLQPTVKSFYLFSFNFNFPKIILIWRNSSPNVIIKDTSLSHSIEFSGSKHLPDVRREKMKFSGDWLSNLFQPFFVAKLMVESQPSSFFAPCVIGGADCQKPGSCSARSRTRTCKYSWYMYMVHIIHVHVHAWYWYSSSHAHHAPSSSTILRLLPAERPAAVLPCLPLVPVGC